jgi:hypothetical protein
VVIAKDRFLAISTIKEMISGAWELDANSPGHERSDPIQHAAAPST